MMSDPLAAPEPAVAPAIVAGHGDFAAGMISAVAQITGRGDLLVPFSNHGLSGEGVEDALAALVDAHDAPLIFTDLAAGSATIAAHRVQRARPSLLIITGATLSTLLQFASRGGRVERALLEHDLERARQSMKLVVGAAGGN